ncbi:hypothetical protein [Rossellomorea aquimaris]|jgi:hypothetical protein|uniref:Uncharacterized protein n=1 Tax=Rossellomorea aquimaris TaxID=189382 RepID=A0A1J6WW77_9BACI|nr:hypothetical protein [Rossellomorea aquimaris]OIU72451.1 hypothetical protein BHE18_07440 [Rossellomorea aquimaris]
MPNWVPFLALTVFSLFLLAYTISKNREKSHLIFLFWLFICGLAFLFEFIIFILFKSYEYDPGILVNQYSDSVLGSIVSQAFAVPVAITFIVVTNLRIRAIIFIIGLFFMIETLFLYLEVYVHYWWRSIFTSMFLILTVILSKLWWNSLDKDRSHYINFTTLFFAMLALTQTGGWILSSLLGLYELPIPAFTEEMRNNITGNFAYLFFSSYLYSLIIYYRNRELPFTIMTVVFLTTIEIAMADRGILSVKEPVYILVLPALHFLLIQTGRHVYRRYFKLFPDTSQKRLPRHE